MSGGGHEHIRGILETSPGAIAVLIVFFLLVTLGFEKGLHHARQSLRRRKKLGLLAAVNNLSSELMLLAVATLFLTALEPAITRICLPAGNTMKPWLANVNGCACCLAKTKGVTACFVEDRQCPADFQEQCNPEEAFFKARLKKATTSKRFAEVSNTSTADAAANHGAPTTLSAISGKRRLAAAAAAASPAALGSTTAGAVPDAHADDAHAVCDGAFLDSYEECSYQPGWAPVVTGETLEQVHMLLFIMAVVHILVSVLVLLLSTLKLRLWNRMGGGAAEDHLAQAAALAAAAAASNTSTHVITAALPAGKWPADPLTDAAAAAMSPASAAAAAVPAAGPVVDKQASDQASGLTRQHSSAAVLVVDAGPAAAAAAAAGGSSLAVPNWRGRPLTMQGPASYLKEFAELALRQLLLLLHPTLTKQEYAVLRASFYLTHLSQATPADEPSTAKAAHAAAGSSHSTADSSQSTSAPPAGTAQGAGRLYAPYLLECVERDGSQTVGLGLPMWILVLAFVLLSGAIGWATWLFLILAGGLLLAINTSLLTTARHMTRGGIVKAQEAGSSRWLVLHNARLLLGCIKLMLFFLAFVISQSVYFAAFFGTESCFFSRTGFQKNPVPWYGIMIIDVCLLLSLALFTLPLYTITSHTLRVDKKLLQQIVQQQQQGAAHAGTSHASADTWEDEH